VLARVWSSLARRFSDLDIRIGADGFYSTIIGSFGVAIG
jgi:hypothetical protein